MAEEFELMESNASLYRIAVLGILGDRMPADKMIRSRRKSAACTSYVLLLLQEFIRNSEL